MVCLWCPSSRRDVSYRRLNGWRPLSNTISRVCIISMVRLYYIWSPTSDVLRSVSAAMLTADIQLGVAILCACLPTYAPLLRLCKGRLKSTQQSSARRLVDYELPSRKTDKGENNLLDRSFTDNKFMSRSCNNSLHHSHKSDPFGDSEGMDYAPPQMRAHYGVGTVWMPQTKY